jgi:hypothetical protein
MIVVGKVHQKKLNRMELHAQIVNFHLNILGRFIMDALRMVMVVVLVTQHMVGARRN